MVTFLYDIASDRVKTHLLPLITRLLLKTYLQCCCFQIELAHIMNQAQAADHKEQED